MNVTGKCHCGLIQYRAKVDPEKVLICHCTDCQVMGSSAYRVSAQIPVEDFDLVSGEPKIYVKTADSGIRRVQAFCAECGTPLYAEALEAPKLRSVRVGSMDQRQSLTPHWQIWCSSALPWCHDLSEITRKLQKQES